jgi:hypothetical protein
MLTRFLKNARGGVAPFMAVVAVPVMGAVGMAVDYTRGGDPTSTLLQNCASSTDKFYLLTSADQITATFNTIGTNLTKLRVPQ